MEPADAEAAWADVLARWRDEVVKRASALALAQLPRTRPPPERSRRLRIALLAAVGAASVWAAAWLLLRLSRAGGVP
jgi:ferric-dicitrate binding protein FerR (iron transport regulator)